MPERLWLRVRIALFAALATVLLAGLALFIVRLPRPDPIVIVLTPVPGSRPAVVYVSGAVQNPGVYALRDGDRMVQAVEAAGGFAPEADRDHINLAAPLRDGQQVHVPHVGERVASARSAPASAPTGRVNINTASIEELKGLPGIGDAYARAIIDYRTKNGPFRRAEDVVKVRGIGPRTYERLKDLITVE